jgi:biopolymer transport protein ExbD
MANREPLPDKISIDMTPMIDCVFQLITFFMLTLKTVISEGDFQIRMPLGVSAGAASDDAVPPVQVKLRADLDGKLAGIQMNGQAVPDFEQLRRKVIDLVGTGPGSNADKTEVELDCDYNLSSHRRSGARANPIYVERRLGGGKSRRCAVFQIVAVGRGGPMLLERLPTPSPPFPCLPTLGGWHLFLTGAGETSRARS